MRQRQAAQQLSDQGSPDVGIGGLRGFIHIVRRFVPYVLRFWDKMLLRVVYQQAHSVIVLINIVAAAKIIDEGLIARDPEKFFLWTGITLVLAVHELLFCAIYANIAIYVVVKTDLILKCAMFRHVQRMSLAFHQLRPIGENMFRINNDTTSATDIATSVLPESLERIMAIATIASLLFALNPLMGAMIAVYIALYFVYSQYIAGFIYRIQKQLRQRLQEVSAILQESFTAFPISKAMSRERHDTRRYYHRLARLMRTAMGCQVLDGVQTEGAALLRQVFMALGYMLVCGWLVIGDRLTIGEYVATSALVVQVTTPMILLVWSMQRLRISCVPAQRMLATLEMPVNIEVAPAAAKLTRPRGEIEFQHVSFRYSADGPEVISDLSFRVEADKKTAIVGMSGAGKTSVFNLLMRFSDPSGGRILIDGTDLRALDLTSYLQHVSVVLQENFLFSATIRDNIMTGNIHATAAQLEDAVARSGLRPLIESLPEGLDTVMLEGGNLSMGQKQRVAIARAILRDPKFLFLDEATSSLDPATELEILRQLAAIEQGRTRVVIAHHIASVLDADEILVMEAGRVVQRGRHQELLEAAGAYQRLWAAEREKTASECGVLVEGVPA